jgi:hypothetical protein
VQFNKFNNSWKKKIFFCEEQVNEYLIEEKQADQVHVLTDVKNFPDQVRTPHAKMKKLAKCPIFKICKTPKHKCAYINQNALF